MTENPKITQRLKLLQSSEHSLLEATEKLSLAENNYNKSMIKVIANYLASSFKCNQDSKTQHLRVRYFFPIGSLPS